MDEIEVWTQLRHNIQINTHMTLFSSRKTGLSTLMHTACGGSGQAWLLMTDSTFTQ